MRNVVKYLTYGLTVKAVSILLATIAVYLQDLTIVFTDAFQSEVSNYMIAIPFMSAYLVYRKRRVLEAAASFKGENTVRYLKHTPVVLGVLLCVFALMFYWYGSYTFTPLEFHMLSLPFFLAGLTLILFNLKTLRHAVFPIVFLVFLTPPPVEALYALGSTLSILSSEVSYGIVRTLGIPSTLSSEYGNPAIIITRPDGATIPFLIDIACSGVYSLIGFTVFSVFIAYIVRDRVLKKTLIFLIGIPLIYSLNILRITLILLIGYGFGEQLALQVFHLMGGWLLIFLGTILLLTVLEGVFKLRIFTEGRPLEPCPLCGLADSEEDFCPYCGRLLNSPKIGLNREDLAKIAAISITVALIMFIQVPVFALTEGPAEVTIHTPMGEQGNVEILPKIQGYDLEFVYRDRDFERRAKQDASLVYAYVPLEEGEDWVFVVVEVASTRSSLHSWEVCLITWPLSHGYQPSVTQLELKDVKLLENPPITARYFAFQYVKTKAIQLVLYWYETAVFTVDQTFQQKHVKISLVAYPDSLEEVPEVERRMVQMAEAIVGYWQPVKTWSPVVLAVAENGQILTAVLATLVLFVLGVQKTLELREKTLNLRLYNKIALEEDRQLIGAVCEADRAEIPTGKTILMHYQKLLGRQVEPKTLMEKLNHAEKAGLIERDVVGVEDKPLLVWRSRTALKTHRRFTSILHVFKSRVSKSGLRGV